MSLNVSIGYGASYITTHPEILAVHERGEHVIVEADNTACTETVDFFLSRQQAATLLEMLQSALGKAT